MRQSDVRLEQQLDKNIYSEKELIEVKVPLNTPYISNSPGFERYNGAIEVNGVHYNYVKRKIYNDTLYLLCIRNTQKTQLCITKNNFQQLAAGVPCDKKNNDVNTKKFNITDEYNFPSSACIHFNLVTSKQNELFFSGRLISGFINANDQPPEA